MDVSAAQDDIIALLRSEVAPATGCTEPVAVAFSTATAAREAGGEIELVSVVVDPAVYKNGMRVGIPGVDRRGLDVAAALGAVGGDPARRFQVLEGVTPDQVARALDLVDQGRVRVVCRYDAPCLFVESRVVTSQGAARSVTLRSHLGVVETRQGDDFEDYPLEGLDESVPDGLAASLTLAEMIEFSVKADIDKLRFLEDGVSMNMAVAERGMASKGIGSTLRDLADQELLVDDMALRAEALCAAASEARMSGAPIPVMSSAGSGNHGITLFLTLAAVGASLDSPRDLLLRALALANLITAAIKERTGRLSPMCGCGVAAGIGAAAGATMLMGGGRRELLAAMSTMAGTLAGMLCDGAKEGCAYKVALAANWAVKSALLAVRGVSINPRDGILANDFKGLVANLGQLCNPGMANTNTCILDIMTTKATNTQ